LQNQAPLASEYCARVQGLGGPYHGRSCEPLHDNRSDIGIVLSKVSGAREGVALMKRERN
jgi:hypothetical protein